MDRIRNDSIAIEYAVSSDSAERVRKKPVEDKSHLHIAVWIRIKDKYVIDGLEFDGPRYNVYYSIKINDF